MYVVIKYVGVHELRVFTGFTFMCLFKFSIKLSYDELCCKIMYVTPLQVVLFFWLKKGHPKFDQKT